MLSTVYFSLLIYIVYLPLSSQKEIYWFVGPWNPLLLLLWAVVVLVHSLFQEDNLLAHEVAHMVGEWSLCLSVFIVAKAYYNGPDFSCFRSQSMCSLYGSWTMWEPSSTKGIIYQLLRIFVI